MLDVRIWFPSEARTLWSGENRDKTEERLKAALSDRYRIEREVGSGGMARVHLAQDVRGESLRSRLTKEKLLPVEDAVQITREIADALAYAHGEGLRPARVSW